MTESDFLEQMNMPNVPRNAEFVQHRAFPGDRPCWGYVCKAYPGFQVTSFLTEDGAECDNRFCIFGCDHGTTPRVIN
jgi:hypothetical protein